MPARKSWPVTLVAMGPSFQRTGSAGATVTQKILRQGGSAMSNRHRALRPAGGNGEAQTLCNEAVLGNPRHYYYKKISVLLATNLPSHLD